MPSFFLLTLGCPKNYVDSEALTFSLAAAGYRMEMKPERADLLVVNTCGFLQAALEEAQNTLKQLAVSKKSHQKLLVFGCAVKRQRSLFSPVSSGADAAYDTWEDVLFSLGQPSVAAGSRLHTGTAYAYVKIADGCDENCAFCAIPSIKGGFQSKPAEVILAEIGSLVAQGIKEMILIAQNTTAYGLDFRKKKEKQEIDTLSLLLRSICNSYPDLPWVRVMYAYPDYITAELIETMKSHPQICRYLDIPLQHASPKILKSMGRPYNIDKTKKTLARLREAMPDLSLRTTFIVGFPGETENDFRDLSDFIRQVGFDWMGVFQYSREPGTVAADLPDQVAEEQKIRRFDELMGLQQTITHQKNQAYVGRTLTVLVEQEIQGKKGYQYLGRSGRSAPDIDGVVYLKGQADVGEIASVRITSSDEYDMTGKIVQN